MFFVSNSFINHYVIKPIADIQPANWRNVRDAAAIIAGNMKKRADMINNNFLRDERVGKGARTRFRRLSLTKTNLAWHAGAVEIGALYYSICQHKDLASIEVTDCNIWQAHTIGAKLKMFRERASFVKDPRELSMAKIANIHTAQEMKLPSEMFVGPTVDAIEGFSPISNGGMSARRQLMETLVGYSIKSSVREKPSP